MIIDPKGGQYGPTLTIRRSDPFCVKETPKYKNLEEDIEDLIEAYTYVVDSIFEDYNLGYQIIICLEDLKPAPTVYGLKDIKNQDLEMIKDAARLWYRLFLRREHQKLMDRIKVAVNLLEANNYIVISQEQYNHADDYLEAMQYLALTKPKDITSLYELFSKTPIQLDKKLVS